MSTGTPNEAKDDSLSIFLGQNLAGSEQKKCIPELSSDGTLFRGQRDLWAGSAKFPVSCTAEVHESFSFKGVLQYWHAVGLLSCKTGPCLLFFLHICVIIIIRQLINLEWICMMLNSQGRASSHAFINLGHEVNQHTDLWLVILCMMLLWKKRTDSYISKMHIQRGHFETALNNTGLVFILKELVQKQVSTFFDTF